MYSHETLEQAKQYLRTHRVDGFNDTGRADPTDDDADQLLWANGIENESDAKKNDFDFGWPEKVDVATIV